MLQDATCQERFLLVLTSGQKWSTFKRWCELPHLHDVVGGSSKGRGHGPLVDRYVQLGDAFAGR